MFFDSRLPFWLHALIETPASINFLLRPSEQLSASAPQADAVIRQYGMLLFVSVLIAVIFVTRANIDDTSCKTLIIHIGILQRIEAGRCRTAKAALTFCPGNVSGALSIYHLGPIARAYSRVISDGFEYGKGLGGPGVHLVVHSACFLSLFLLCIRGRGKKRFVQGKE